MLLRTFIRVSSFIVAVFLAVVTVGVIEEDQASFPLASERTFTLSVGNSSVPKSELIASFDEVVDSTGALVVKTSVSKTPQGTGQDLVVFGSEGTAKLGELVWFNPGASGQFVSSSQMGTRPLDGYFGVTGCAECSVAFDQWAAENAVSLSWGQYRSTSQLITGSLLSSGAGIAMVSMTLLLVGLCIAWFLASARARAILLMGGVLPWRIHAHALSRLGVLIAPGLLLGAISALAAVYLQRGQVNALLFLRWYGGEVSAALVGMLVIVLATSLLTRPTAKQVGRREVPLASFRKVGGVVRSLAVLVAVVAVPFTLHFAQAARNAADEASRWEGAADAVKLTFGGETLEADVLEAKLGSLRDFSNEVSARDLAVLSLAVDSQIQIPSEVLGNFDHIVVTDKGFLELMNLTAGESGQGGDLVGLSFDSLSAPQQQFVEAQLSVWLEDGISQDRVSYYQYTGQGSFPAVGSGVGNGQAIQARNLLILLVDDPLRSMSTARFTVPAMSGGNLIFKDAEAVQELLVAHQLDGLVTSVDRVADLTLEGAETFSRQSTLAAYGLVLIAATILIALLQSARIWATLNSRLIFAKRTRGESWWDIQLACSVKELAFVVVVAAVAAAVFAGFTSSPVRDISIGLGVLIPMYVLTSAGAYAYAASESFRLSTHRRS